MDNETDANIKRGRGRPRKYELKPKKPAGRPKELLTEEDIQRSKEHSIIYSRNKQASFRHTERETRLCMKRHNITLEQLIKIVDDYYQQ